MRQQWAKNVVIWTKNFLNPEKFPQTACGRLDLFSCLLRFFYEDLLGNCKKNSSILTASGRLDLFLCLGQAMQTSDFVAY